MLYTALAWSSRRAMRWCYRDVVVAGEVPSAGPVLLAVNHPNDLPDICAILGHVNRRVFFVANVTAAEQPLVSWAYSRMGVVPVHRVRDARRAKARGENSVEANERAFARVRELLARGECVCVFPEGGVHRGPHLGPLRTGLARMALDARDLAGLRGLKIVPVGLTYEAPLLYRSGVSIEVGLPIELDAWVATEGRRPESQLTSAIGAALRSVTRHEQADAFETACVVHESRQPALAALSAIPGLILHAPAWVAVRWLAKRAAPSAEEVIPRTIIPGLYVMAVWYVMLAVGLWAMLVRVGLGAWLALGTSLLVIAAAPALGDAAMRWLDRVADGRRLRAPTREMPSVPAHNEREVI